MKKILRDIGVAALAGLISGAALGLVAFAVGMAAGGVGTGAEAARTVLMLGAGAVLIYSAVLIVRGGNLPPDAFRLFPRKRERAERDEFVGEREKLIRCIPAQYAALVASVPLLSLSALADFLVRSIGG